ncbi:MAG: hypothetical protein ACYDAE_29665 [Steroidobacteraceae bacterium]
MVADDLGISNKRKLFSSRFATRFVIEYRRRYGEMKVEIVTEGRLIDIIKKCLSESREGVLMDVGRAARWMITFSSIKFETRFRLLGE